MSTQKLKWRHNSREIKMLEDNRGFLGEFEISKLNFDFKRIYWVTVKVDKKRGFHAHKELSQFLVVLSGQLEIKLDDSKNSVELLLLPGENLLIKPGVWREFVARETDTTILILASQEYSEQDYIRNYEEFVKWTNELL